MKYLVLLLLLVPILGLGQVTERNLIDVPMGFVITQSKVEGAPAYKKGEPSVTLLFTLNKRKAEKPLLSKEDSLTAVKDAKDSYDFLESYSLFLQDDKSMGMGQHDTFFPAMGTWSFDEKKQELVWIDDEGSATLFTVTKPADRIVLTISTSPDNVTEFIEYK